MTEKKEFFTAKICALVDKIGGINETAALIGKTDRQVRRYCEGEQEPPFSIVADLVQHAGMSLSEVFGAFPSENNSYSLAIDMLDAGQTVDTGKLALHKKVLGRIGVDVGFFATEFGYKPETIFATHWYNDTMAPTIEVMSLIFLTNDPEFIEEPSDGIYLILINKKIEIKRVQFLRDGKCSVISDNKVYKSYECPVGDIKFLGKAVINVSIKRI